MDSDPYKENNLNMSIRENRGMYMDSRDQYTLLKNLREREREGEIRGRGGVLNGGGWWHLWDSAKTMSLI